MRIMGLDYGSRTVGVALSDELLITAQAKEIIRRKEENKLRRTLARIEELITTYGVEKIVLGLPVNMDMTPSERSQLCLEFKDRIERRTDVPVVMWDERLTTVAADEIMDELGIKGRERKEYVDMIAAQVILQDYLDNRKE
ncbi:MAG: Holliday junction resolvase RuvX [Butyrivibrio sp.]|nr:Holliday junction resolvase RuvX [Butyrivibrio sp.]MBR4358086.1 Holliday junction resolvase RuvX [Butyrivibrio sp.]MBR4640887.1 Holliday junction resolvase RuvX [Butyrivibrio sp.]MCR4997481.1 Holliday junction resolvase RuvX [Butyrivibrio sp.]MEE3469514.1 Holliday junction resolvase RuvX [Butyrivibrio hungatei]